MSKNTFNGNTKLTGGLAKKNIVQPSKAFERDVSGQDAKADERTRKRLFGIICTLQYNYIIISGSFLPERNRKFT